MKNLHEIRWSEKVEAALDFAKSNSKRFELNDDLEGLAGFGLAVDFVGSCCGCVRASERACVRGLRCHRLFNLTSPQLNMHRKIDMEAHAILRRRQLLTSFAKRESTTWQHMQRREHIMRVHMMRPKAQEYCSKHHNLSTYIRLKSANIFTDPAVDQ